MAARSPGCPPAQEHPVVRIGLDAKPVARNGSVLLESQIPMRRQRHQHDVTVRRLDPLERLAVARRARSDTVLVLSVVALTDT